VEVPALLDLLDMRNLFGSGEVRADGRKLLLKDTLSTLPFAAITNAK
jgi:hypothetical protein